MTVKSLQVTVLHQIVAADASADVRDVLMQRDAVIAALEDVGHQTEVLEVSLDLETARFRLQQLKPDVVFNLVESLGETDRLAPLVTLLLDAMEIPYSGVQTQGLISTLNKLTSKGMLRIAALPTPNWLTRDSIENANEVPEQFSGGRWIVKPVWEHASFGIDDRSVLDARIPADIQQELERREQTTGRPHLAEQFIDGREFNLSLLAGEVLPPAEIDFLDFPMDKPKIVGHSAKWEADSFEYRQTPRRFEFAELDGLLLDELADLAIGCWDCFKLNGYARVDFRVDQSGRPFILEVNANPCLSPDAGFAAAVEAAGFSFAEAIERIIKGAIQ